MTPRATLPLLLLAAACGPTREPAPSSAPAPSSTPAPSSAPAPAPTPSSAPSSAPAPSPTSSSAPASADAPADLSPPPRLRATMAMAMSSPVDAAGLPAMLNRQMQPLARCAALLRKTDKVTGSLNLRVTIAAGGRVTPQLQSPVPPDVERCILEGAARWSVPKAGAGEAMVLLNVDDPTPAGRAP